MATTSFGNSYAAQSLGLSPTATGGTDIGGVLRSQMAQLAKKRATRGNIATQPGQQLGQQPMSAAFDLLGKQPLG